MSIQDWAEEHNELENGDIVNKETYDYGILINEHVDYRIVMEISLDSYGHKYVDIIEETLQVFDDDGNIVDSFNVTLPKKYRDQAIKAVEDYEI